VFSLVERLFVRRRLVFAVFARGNSFKEE